MKKITKILVSALLLMAMLLTMMPIVSAAGETQATTTGVSYFSGKSKADLASVMSAVKADYTDDKTVTIDSADKLVAFAHESASTTFKGATVNITKDIVINKGNAANWINAAPAFTWPGINNFSGTFNGNGHTISGIYMKSGDSNPAKGFFNQLNQAATTINDVGFVNSLFIGTGSSYGPAIIGRTNTYNTTLNNCYSNAITINSSSMTGGFVTLATNSITKFNNCVYDGFFLSSVDAAMGAFVGRAGYYDGQSAYGAELTNCVNRGYVASTATTKESGGALVGHASYVKIKNCANIGTGYTNIVGKISGTGSDTTNLGIPDSKNVVIDNCYYTGNAFLVSAANTKYASNITNSGSTTTYSIPTLNVNLADEMAGATEHDGFSSYANAHAYSLKYIKEMRNNTKNFDIPCEDALVGIAAALNSGYATNSGSGYTITLNRDMTFNEGNAADWATTAPEFVWMTVKYFKGTFNGNGHNLSGIYMNTASGFDLGTSSGYYYGIFAVLNEGAKILNLGVVNSYITTTSDYAYMGTIVGRMDGKNIEVNGCYSDAIISGIRAGGIVGMVTNTVAKTNGNAATAAKIANCVFAGEITSNISHVGGIVGMTGLYNSDTNWHDMYIVNCLNLGKIKATKTDGTQANGGILGWAQGARVTLERCLNLGQITIAATSGTDRRVGSLYGRIPNATGNSITLIDCYIFTDLGQEYFTSNASINSCNKPNYSINGTANVPSDAGSSADNPETHIQKIVANKALYTKADSNAIKGTAFFDEDWTARANIMGADYPMPTVVYNNFFKVALKYAQTTDVVNGVYTARIIARVDTHLYQKVGFEVIVNDGTTRKELKKEYCEFNYIFKTVTGSGTDGLTSVTAPGDTYFAAISLSDLPTTVTSIEIQPYTVGDDGEVTYGTAKTLNFNANGEYVGVAN